jgi:DNA-directed RNA polymerase subunit RPC12/RpoP
LDSLPVNYSYNALWEYNTQTNTWTAKSNSPVYRQHAGNFAIGSYGYFTGGITRNGVFKDAYRYAPVQDGWTGVATFPGEARYAPVSFSTASYGYIGFGHNLAGSHLNDLWKFEPIYAGNNGTWRAVGSYQMRGHFVGAGFNSPTSDGIATIGYIAGVNCNNESELYTNSLNYYQFNELTGSIVNLNFNINNPYANKSVDYKKTGESLFNLNNNLILLGGLGKTSEVSITPNPPLNYSQVEYNISYIIPIVYESPFIENTEYRCRICGNIINDILHTKSYTGIATHSIIQCDTCQTAYSSWYGTNTLATYWIGGFTNNIKTSYVCDGIEYAPIYPDVSKGNRKILDQYITTYSAIMKVIT